MNRTLAAICLLGLAGCSVELTPKLLDTTPATNDAARSIHNAPLTGVVYKLPYARFDISLAWTLEACDTDKAKISLKGSAKPSYIADPTKTFVLDYMDLSSVLKTSKFSFEPHENDMLKTIGAAAADQTGPVIVGTLKTIASIASTVSGLRAGSGAAGLSGPSACTDKARNALEKVETTKAASEKATLMLNEATDRIKALFAIYATLGPSNARVGGAFLDEGRALLKLREKSDAAAQAHATALKVVTITQSVTWPLNPDVFAERIAPDPEKLIDKKWFNPSADITLQAALELRGNDVLALDLPSLDGAKLAEEGKTAVPWKPIASAPAASPGGVIFRQPVQGTLSVHFCGDWSASRGTCSASKQDTLATTAIPQLGRLQVLPYRNGPFQNNELTATFAESGALTKVTYEEKSSQALSVVQASQDAVLAVQAGIKDVRAAGPAAELANLKARTELATQRAALTKALEALNPPKTNEEKEQTALFDTNTALKKAEVANIEATQALVVARTKAATP